MIDFDDFSDHPITELVYFAQTYAQLLIDGVGWSTTGLGLYDLNGERSAYAGEN